MQSLRALSLLALISLVAPANAAGASSSAPAPVPTAAPARTEIIAMDTWEVTCAYDKDNRKLGCNALLRVTEPAAPANGNEPARPQRVFLVWALSKANDGSLYSSFQTLTGIRVQPGLQLKLDSLAARTIPFDSCGSGGCVAIGAMDPEFLKQAKNAAQIQATVQGTDGKAYTATFAPKGIDRAVSAVL